MKKKAIPTLSFYNSFKDDGQWPIWHLFAQRATHVELICPTYIFICEKLDLLKIPLITISLMQLKQHSPMQSLN